MENVPSSRKFDSDMSVWETCSHRASSSTPFSWLPPPPRSLPRPPLLPHFGSGELGRHTLARGHTHLKYSWFCSEAECP